VAIYEGGMTDHWLFGYGHDADPGWGPKIDGRELTDIVNHYLILLSRFGVLALIAFLAVNVCAIRNVIRAYKRTRLRSERWFVWCLGSGMVALAGVFMTVSLFGQPRTVYYMMLAFCGVMPRLVTDYKKSNRKQQKRKRIVIERYIEAESEDLVGC
jgi:O-antigen ligase